MTGVQTCALPIYPHCAQIYRHSHHGSLQLSAFASVGMALPFSHALGVSGHDLVLLALFGLVNSALGMALFTLGSKFLPPIETALLGALDAPLAPVWVWLAFGETPSVATLAGGGIVFAAVAAHIVRQASNGATSSS